MEFQEEHEIECDFEDDSELDIVFGDSEHIDYKFCSEWNIFRVNATDANFGFLGGKVIDLLIQNLTIVFWHPLPWFEKLTMTINHHSQKHLNFRPTR
jgi:hypothetical protein